MGFKVRGYDRDVPQEKVRDYSLFAIACEGTDREPEYFGPFDGINRIKVDIIEDEEQSAFDEGAQTLGPGSSPSRVLDRVKLYLEKNQLDAGFGDTLWCVIDVDRWPQDQIDELYTFCAQSENRHLVISNPCFEIWLLYHEFSDLSRFNIKLSKDAKRALCKMRNGGGYYYIKALPLLPKAILNAAGADIRHDGYMPALLGTKVYHLGEALMARIGTVRFAKFVSSLPELERELLSAKRRKDKKALSRGKK